MKKQTSRILAFLLSILITVGTLPITAFAAAWDGLPAVEAPEGSGTQEEPYQITDAADLKWFANAVNGSTSKSTSTLCAVLTADIDLAGQEWTPIGVYNSYNDCVYYGGVFNGDGKTVSGLSIDTTKQYQALFGYVKGATIKNLTVKGTVKTAATSSSYAAGIVAYGYPVTMENCTNQVNVTASTKGYAAGVVAYTSGGSRIVNCTNTGAIIGCGDFVGGVVGTATGSSSTGNTVIQNCLNTGAVSNTGTPSSYTYSVGGIAGGISGGSILSMCGNTGNVTSTIKRTGGVVGSLAGSVEKCFNTGNVTGIYGVGGIAGDSADAASTITACYNTGSVTAVDPIATFSDTNAKGVGGIIGGVSSNSYRAALKDCYHTGAVTLNSTLSDVTSGGIVGNSTGKNYSGTITTGLVTADNCYYEETAAAQGDGYDVYAAGIVQKTDAEMKAAGFAAMVGADYIDDPDGGYPLLGWQDPNAQYTVTFTLEPADAILTVTGETGVVTPEEGTTYRLKNGCYSYTVTCEECEDAAGSFTVAYGGQNISVTLQVKTYDFVFTTEPADAILTVAGQTPLADGRTYQLTKAGNPYAYTVSAYGYDPTAGTVTVTGDIERDKLTVSLNKQALHTVTFPFVREAGGIDSEVLVQVTSTAYPTAVITPEADGSFALPDGAYSYVISSSGYKSVKGEFTVQGTDLTLPQAYLEIQTAWDGKTVTEPAKDSEGVYQITNPDELMWFQKNAVRTDSARLLADIRINEDLTADELYVWTPIGTTSSNAYTGEFDGDGHTLSGLVITTSNTSNGGLFGFVGTGGAIHNLTLTDSAINCASTKYVGGIVGDLKGTITNCHIDSTVSVIGKAYVGGIVGELDTGGTVSVCSNAGSVSGVGTTTSDGYVGGIAGRVYANASNALTDSVNTGSVSGYNYVGGIAGSVYMGGTLQNVYNTGSVTAENGTLGTAGGLVGHLRTGAIRNAYVSGSISAVRQGGIIGSLDYASGAKTLEQVYYLTSVADETVGYNNGCTIQNNSARSCTAAELQIMADALGDAFYEQNDGYPLLYWQVGETVTDPNAPTPDPDGWNGKTSSTAPKQVDGVYQISTPAELKWFAKAAANTHDIQGVLLADIDLNYQPWQPIGGGTADTAFIGTLDGNGKTISHLYLNTGSAAGLFAYNGGEIKDLTVRGLLRGADYVATVAAYNNGIISGVTAEATLLGGNHVAGITSYNGQGGMILNCRNTGAISGGQYVAGITADNLGTILDCGNSGAVTGTNSFVAGVAADNRGTVKNSANSGQIIGKAALRYAYVGGVIGRNDGTAQSLYNNGNVVGLGSSVGGCVAINTTGSSAQNLYNAGDVCGCYIETEDGEDFRVGGAVGEVVSGVTEAYTLDTLAIRRGGTLISSEELHEKAGSLATMLPVKSSITGTAVLGALQAEDTATVTYQGNATQPVLIWYYSDGTDEITLAVSEEYTIPADMVGYILRVKVMDPALSGIVTGASEQIDGLTGSVKINGYAVVGHSLEAVYTGAESAPNYQWYRGSLQIESATDAVYAVTTADEGKILTVRVTGSKPGYIEQKTATVLTGDQAGVWPEAEMREPQSDSESGYLITNEAELKWFASFVNGGHPATNAKLTADLSLTSEKWYSIGNSRYPYTGVFDGNGKRVEHLTLTSSSDEQGFFGNVGGKGEVKHLAVSGSVTATGEALSTGGIAGYLEGKITDCSFTGSVQGVQDVGGIVGQAGLNSTIERCVNYGTVAGKENIGGIAGSISYGNILECVNTSAIGCENAVYAGGIAGSMTNYTVVTACYNTGHVIGSDYLGGIAGAASVCAAPQGCYNVGEIDKGMHAFGVLGDLSGTDYIVTTQGSYYLAESEQEATDRTAQGVSSASMRKAAFVTLLNAQAGKTAFVINLNEENSGYPLLLWQVSDTPDEGDPSDPDNPQVLTVTFTLCGDTAHGSNGTHIAYTDWIETTSCTLPNGATAYDLFRKMISAYGLSYEANGNSYVSSVTNLDGVVLAEFTNGPRSGWMYTINGQYPDYMAAVKLKDGDDMRFFYTDDYQDTNWSPADPVVTEVERLIDAIGTVTLESGEAIQTARNAYDLLTDGQKLLVSNFTTLEEAERLYAQLVAEKPEKDRAAAAEVDRLINAIGVVTLDSWDAITAARHAYDALTNDQKALVTGLTVLCEAEEAFKQLVGEKIAADMAAADAVDQLIEAIGSVTVRSKASVQAARAAYDALTDEQRAYVTKETLLQQAEETLNRLLAEQTAQRENIYRMVGDTLLSGSIPIVSSVNGEWVVLGLARSGRISETFKAGYYQNLVQYLREIGSETLHTAKSTENSRVIIALTALGYDVTNVDGKNLLLPLADAEYLSKQGINGTIWALIAFDTADYIIPTVESGKVQTTRENLIQTILAAQTASGGWSMDEEYGDVDITAMALLALAPYAESDPAVQAAIDKAILFLSEQQRSDGGFVSFGRASAESCAQVVAALSTLGIDPDQDARFIKNGHSVLDALLAFYQNGGFRHTMDGEVDSMATEQGYYALTAYMRLLDGKHAIFDMSDVVRGDNPVIEPEEKDTATSSTPVVDDPDTSGNQTSSTQTGEISSAQTSETSSPMTGDSADTVWFILLLSASALCILMIKKGKSITE